MLAECLEPRQKHLVARVPRTRIQKKRFGREYGFSIEIVLVLLALEYHAIVRWEERLLESRIGTSYVAYLGQVPRWIPKGMAPKALDRRAPFSWKETIFSERGTLIAIAAGYALLMLKAADLGAILQ